MSQNKTNYSAVLVLTTVFFFWGFIAAGNSVFIPFCKHYFDLDQFQSQLIDFAFYGAYYIGALALFIFSTLKGKDLVGLWGYKKSIIFGLVLSAIGAGAMILSVYVNLFVGMLLGLFVVALGFSLQQTSTNPFMIALGDEATGSNRISLGGGINSLGTTIGPLVVSLILFGTAAAMSDDMIAGLSLEKVMLLYAGVGLLFLAIALMLKWSKNVPDGKLVTQENSDEQPLKAVRLLTFLTGLIIVCFAPVFYSYRENISWDNTMAENIRMACLILSLVSILGTLLFANWSSRKNKAGWGAMQYPQLTLGMLAIFFYVGVEVAIGSNLGELLKQERFGALQASEISPYIAMFWGSLMIGRWTGAINSFEMKEQTKTILKVIVPLVAFGVVLLFTKLSGYEVDMMYGYVVFVLIQIIANYLTKDKPALTLGVFALGGIASLAVGLLSVDSTIAVYGFMSAGLFCSIMWPCIFALSLEGLGKYKTQGSAFLIMMILGGAIIPPLQGKLSDIIGIQVSFVVGVLCFAYLALYAFSRMKRS